MMLQDSMVGENRSNFLNKNIRFPILLSLSF
uniref:Uncharacterized protein n=1 Tax=Rhizophora mucronata TaxID=61149 RepID=A0A2P2P8Y4_RHIMU